MKVGIYHLVFACRNGEFPDRVCLDAQSGFNADRQDFAIRTIWDRAPAAGFANYNLVAVVDVDDLEKAFEVTNHIDHDWTKNPHIIMCCGSARSSSVGDVFVVDGVRHVVASSGFRTL